MLSASQKINQLILNSEVMLPDSRNSFRRSLGRLLKCGGLTSGCILVSRCLGSPASKIDAGAKLLEMAIRF